MKLTSKTIAALFISSLCSTATLANNVEDTAKTASSWVFTPGMGAGGMHMQGNRYSEATVNGVFDSVTPGPRKLSKTAAAADFFAGLHWRPSHSAFGIGIEPYYSYTNVTRNLTGFTLVNIGGFNVAIDTNTKVEAKQGFGGDIQPSFYAGNNRVYLIVGAERRNFKYTHTSGRDRFTKSWNRWALNWGFGLEHLFADHSIGIQFKHRKYGKMHFAENIDPVNAITIRGQMKPSLTSLVLTYRYRLNFGS